MDVDEDFTLVTSKRKRGPAPEQKPLELKGLKLKEVQKRLRIDKHGNAYLLPAPEPPKQPSGSSWSRVVSDASRNPKPWTKTPSREYTPGPSRASTPARSEAGDSSRATTPDPELQRRRATSPRLKTTSRGGSRFDVEIRWTVGK